MTSMKAVKAKAQRDHEASLDRQRQRAAKRVRPDQAYRNKIGANLARAILAGLEQHREQQQDP